MKIKAKFAVILCLVLCTGLAYAAGPQKAALKSEDCLACHSDASMVNGKAVKPDAFQHSIHGSMFSCVDCHDDVKSLSHDSNLAKPKCSKCHEAEQQQFDASLHGKAFAAGNKKAPTCEACHGNIHEILPASDPNSKIAHKNIPATCGTCHSNNMASAGIWSKPAVSYQESVHGKLVASGSDKAAVCSDCHTAHDVRATGDPQSSTFKANVPQTCAKCHAEEQKKFAASVHGKAITAGNTHAPNCTDCHGVHLIKRPSDPTSTVAAQGQAEKTCAQCHESVRMSAEFGVPGGRTSTYLASYHGLANEGGSKSAASCSSCHTAHSILPSSDPASSVNPINLPKTCGQCHPGANANFAKGKMHLDPTQVKAADMGTKINAWVRVTYLGLIFGTIGFMFVHNLIIWLYKMNERRKGHAHHSEPGPRVVVRMTKKQRIQHAFLFVSFFTLVLTGFALKYPDSLLARVFVTELVRSYIHRFAGALMIVVSIYHVFYCLFTAEGRRLALDMMPELKDATDIVDVFAYYLGFSSKRPQFKRFNYAEKMEYLALVWGTFVMAATGTMIWFKVQFGDLVPRWWIDVATTIHFYEAILATLAILVWHFYMIIFDPDTYPMNWAWLDGKMSVEHYREEHGLDSETLSKIATGEAVRGHGKEETVESR
ncbi:MAG TPA: cytochrome b/b6 domain-containing protein [candidate division Zixibacteria bacterium]|nr:cytochrome b/b6 domain-containing protein [candidate division Zixibacteria bacterium]